VDIAALNVVVSSSVFVCCEGIVGVVDDIAVSVVEVVTKGLDSIAVCVFVIPRALVVEVSAAVADPGSDDV
jgi:hypothetical protein